MKVLRLPGVIEMTGLSKTTIYTLMNQGSFPKPIKIGEARNSRSGWIDTEIQDWIIERIKERDNATG